MKLRVLGAGAGGGLPQWNCACRNCTDARNGKIEPMTQSSLAASIDGKRWVLMNASPDIITQINRCEELHPRKLRHSPIKAAILTNGDIDHIGGLLSLREKTAFVVYGTQEALEILRTNAVFNVLDPDLVSRIPLQLDEPIEPVPGLKVTPFSVPGKVALYLEGDKIELAEIGEQTVGLLLECETATLAYVPGCAALPDWLLERLAEADVLLFDGTVWENDDMSRTGTGTKSGKRMGHIPMAGTGGSLDRLEWFAGRKIYVHINNTNPILQPCGPERQTAVAKGWEIAYDGMEITL
ncbi:MAG: pyrroloquinoline quinone biosynthesis protein PqqB [Pseudomonadota bacterium]